MQKEAFYSAHQFGVILLLSDGSTYSIEKYYIAEILIKYGGSFTQALGEALHRADPINTQKILSAWEEDIHEFIVKFSSVIMPEKTRNKLK